MSRMSGVMMLGLLAGCAPQVNSTFVSGSVQGVTLPAAEAVATHDQNILGGERDTVLIASHRGLCSRVTWAGIGQPSGVGSEAAREPALILQQGNALFDTGNGTERLRASKSTFDITERDGNFTRGHFSATFGSDTLSGDFIALQCSNLSPGCSTTPGVLLLGVAAWLLRRRQTSPGH